MEIYRKILLLKEDDLPKKAGNYIVMTRNGSPALFPFNLNDEHVKYTWMQNVDWYFYPHEIL